MVEPRGFNGGVGWPQLKAPCGWECPKLLGAKHETASQWVPAVRCRELVPGLDPSHRIKGQHRSALAAGLSSNGFRATAICPNKKHDFSYPYMPPKIPRHSLFHGCLASAGSQGDLAAYSDWGIQDRGAPNEDERLSCLAEKYSLKQRMYGDPVIRIQRYIIHLRSIKARLVYRALPTRFTFQKTMKPSRRW